MSLKVTQGDTGSYGYVYFSDGTRVGFAVSIPTGLPHGMFPANWGGNTEGHFKLAEEWLDKNLRPVAMEVG